MNHKSLPTVGVIGCGLVGGSIALAASRKGYPVIGTDSDITIKDEFIRRTGSGWAHTLEALVKNSDIIIIAVHADKIPQVVDGIVSYLKPGSVLADVASTKTSPTIALKAAAAKAVVVGTHPMAGKATSGFKSADPDLFIDCTWVLCPSDGERVPASLGRLIVDLGTSQTVVCSPEEHDRAVAAISHSVQVGASSLAAAVNSAVSPSSLPWLLAAGGWRDSTRIAESSPDMWVPILTENKDNVIPILEKMEDKIKQMRKALLEEDADTMHALITEGQEARRNWREACS